MAKLSELSDEIYLVSEKFGRLSVSDIKDEILVHGHDSSKDGWCIPINKKWTPCAKYMVERYIDGEYDDMYEGWDERANKALSEADYGKIQAILEEAFTKHNCTDYYEYGELVEIDILPKATESTESA